MLKILMNDERDICYIIVIANHYLLKKELFMMNKSYINYVHHIDLEANDIIIPKKLLIYLIIINQI